MFVVSKLLGALTQPMTWIVAMLVFGLWLGRLDPRRGRGILWSAVLATVVLGWLPLPDLLLRRLEQSQPVPAAPSDAQWSRYEGVVVLGGALENASMRVGNGQVALNSSAERMTLAAALALAHPQLKVVFTGGDGTLLRQKESESRQARQFFNEIGLPAGRVVFEGASRTTYENAVYSASLAGVDKRKPWLLLTSGWHMPRSLATFRHVGWNVTPYTVDYLAGASTPWTHYGLVSSLHHWQTALHEMLGLLAYRMSGQAQ